MASAAAAADIASIHIVGTSSSTNAMMAVHSYGLLTYVVHYGLYKCNESIEIDYN